MLARRKLLTPALVISMIIGVLGVFGGWMVAHRNHDATVHPVTTSSATSVAPSAINVGTGQPAASPVSSVPAQGQAGAVTFRPSVIPLGAPEIPNSMRGQYEWNQAPADPVGWPVRDVYYRDQIKWGYNLEKTRGVYDFSLLDQGIAHAKQLGGRFGFRIIADCRGCGGNWTPAYVPRQPNGLPAYNSEGFQTAWANLMAALGRRYATNPRVGFVDVGGYGPWAEWHDDGLEGEKITMANARRMILAVLAAFPTTHVIMNASDPGYATLALQISPRVGLRQDCVGGPDTMMWVFNQGGALINDRWKTAPVLSEWCSAEVSIERGLQHVRKHHFSTLSSGNYPTRYAQMSSADQAAFIQANKTAGYRYALTALSLPGTLRANTSFSVSATWLNAGVAPTYQRWQVGLQLLAPSAAIAARVPLGMDLRQVLPGARTLTSTGRLGALAPGRYTVRLVISDPTGVVAPLALATTGRTPSGAYPLGSITVAV